MKIAESYEGLTGNTPILHAKNYQAKMDLGANIFLKLEMMNPSRSVKDRAAVNMILDAEEKGLIKKGGTIIEPTSGNTGIGLAAFASSRGYKTIITMPDSMSIERRELLKAYGAHVILTDGKLGMPGAIKKAEELSKEIENSFMPAQFENKANSQAHYKTTGPEIWEQMDSNIFAFVAGVGTGGTLTGVSAYLKQQNYGIRVIAVEPEKSAVLSGGDKGAHGLQGIGAGFISNVLDVGAYDEVMRVSEEQAFETCRQLIKTEGLLCGISSGAALFAASVLAKHEKYKNKNIVVLLPDTGERYLSTGIFI